MGHLGEARKGFVIAIDALLSLVILFSLLGLAFEVSQQNGSEIIARNDLGRFAFHSGLAMEQSGMLSRAVIANNTNEVRTFLNAWPATLCGSVSMYNSPDSNTPVFVVSKSGCTLVLGEAETVQRGVMVPSPPDANLYVAKISAWVNRG